MALYGFSLSLPTIVKNMGFTAADAQVGLALSSVRVAELTLQGLSAPPYVFASICVVASGFFSDKYRLRAATIIVPSFFAFV